MVQRWRDGIDVVYGVRKKRDGDSWIKRTVAGIFYRLLRWLSDTDIPADAGDFRLISRPVVDVLKEMPERDRYTRGLVSWSGFSQEPIYFDRPERFAGTTKYPVSKLMRLATAGVVGFSDKPLFLTIGFGLGAMVLAVLGLIWVIVSTLFSWGEQIRGWTSMAVLLMFFSAVQLIFLGIVGIYISRIFVEAKHRPIFIVEHDSRDDS
jgi:dolichol-phosphate mannosyltransferase